MVTLLLNNGLTLSSTVPPLNTENSLSMPITTTIFRFYSGHIPFHFVHFQLLSAMKSLYSVDVDQMIATNLKRMSASIISRAPASALKDSCMKAINDCLVEEEKKVIQMLFNVNTTTVLYV